MKINKKNALKLEEIKDIMDEQQEEKTWKKGSNDVSDELKWETTLNGMLRSLKTYPTVEDWAANHRDMLEKIKAKIEQILRSL